MPQKKRLPPPLTTTIAAVQSCGYVAMFSGTAEEEPGQQDRVQEQVQDWVQLVHSHAYARQDRTAILDKISPIFRSFSDDDTPSAICLPTGLQIPPISADFLPIFCLKWYPILFITGSMVPHLPFFRPHGYGFRLFSEHLPAIFCRSCLAGYIQLATRRGLYVKSYYFYG